MHFLVPTLSLVGLILGIAWVLFSMQGSNMATQLGPALMEAMPYLILFMCVMQAALLFMLASSKRENQKNQDNILNLEGNNKIGSGQFNSEWVLDTLAGGVIAADSHGQISYINASAERLTLWSREHAIGEYIGQVLKLEDMQGEQLTEKLLAGELANSEQPMQFGQVKLFPRVGDCRFVELNITHIANKVHGVVVTLRDVTADRRVINRLYRQASRDGLTDLMNRVSFEQYVEQLAHDSSGLTRSHVLASIDLDNFKTINDTCGHSAGDELLKQVAQIFRRSVRSADKVARIGGDEFAVFLEGCGLDKGHGIMESILTELRNFRFSWEGKVFTIGASIGLLEFMPSADIRIKTLFTDVDKACYTAKALGRNRVFIHAQQEVEAISGQQVKDWGKLLRNTIIEDRFILFVQPVKPLQSEYLQYVRQFEVLLRLPFRQALLNPGSFLPVADRLDLMPSIDRWIIRKSLEKLAEYHNSNNSTDINDIRLMINLSAQMVQDAELFSYVDSQLKKYSIPASSICFEIAESVAIGNFVHTKRVMNALHELGCHLVLDDFGSGFSSLSYLRELPLSFLKIDGNFVHNLVSSPVDAAMIKAVHDVAQVMNLLTIAELVEDAETLQQLREIGVDFAQGFYCGRPIPLDQLCRNEQTTSPQNLKKLPS